MKILTIDIKDFYLFNGNDLEEPEYMTIHIDDITRQYRDKYSHMANRNGRLLIELSKTIYGLRQAGQIAQKNL